MAVAEQGQYVVALHRVGDATERVLQRADDETTGRAHFEGYSRDYRGKGERGELILRDTATGEVLLQRQLRG